MQNDVQTMLDEIFDAYEDLYRVQHHGVNYVDGYFKYGWTVAQLTQVIGSLPKKQKAQVLGHLGAILRNVTERAANAALEPQH